MRLLMLSGDRQVAVGERGPFYAMQAAFSTYFERIDVLCPRPPREPSVHTIHGNVHVHPATCGRAGMVRYLVSRGRELVAEHGHALVVSHDYGWFYNGLAAARLAADPGVPYLSEIHHVPGVPVAADLRERFDRAVAKRYVRWARGRARAFRVVNATEMPALLRRWGVPEDRIRVVPSLYIDLEVFRPAAEEAAPEQDVVFVGRLVANKGIERIVDALAILNRERPVRALFVGRGPLRAALDERIARAGLGDACRFVEWIDSQEELAEAYRRSRVVVCASTCEGGPRFTVEAMACGIPAVSTPVGVMEGLLASGEAGRLADFTAPGLAAALAEVLGDEARRRTMGRRARELSLPYEYGAAIENYARELHDLAGEPAP